ncbi:MAG: hypothetical protein WC308_04670 [archaeon]
MSVDKRLVFALVVVLALSVFVYAASVSSPASGASVEKWFAFLNAKIVSADGVIKTSEEINAANGPNSSADGTIQLHNPGIKVEYDNDEGIKSYKVTCTKWVNLASPGFSINVNEAVPNVDEAGKPIIHGEYSFYCGWIYSTRAPALVVYRKGVEAGASPAMLDCFGGIKQYISTGMLVGGVAGSFVPFIGSWTVGAIGAGVGGVVGVVGSQYIYGLQLATQVVGSGIGEGTYSCSLESALSAGQGSIHSNLVKIKFVKPTELEFARWYEESITSGTFYIQVIPEGVSDDAAYPRAPFDGPLYGSVSETASVASTVSPSGSGNAPPSGPGAPPHK